MVRKIKGKILVPPGKLSGRMLVLEGLGFNQRRVPFQKGDAPWKVQVGDKVEGILEEEGFLDSIGRQRRRARATKLKLLK